VPLVTEAHKRGVIQAFLLAYMIREIGEEGPGRCIPFRGLSAPASAGQWTRTALSEPRT